MTAAADIITAAYREGNLIPIGQTPTAAEQTEALARLNSLMLSAPGVDFSELLTDWVAPAPQRTAALSANYPQLPYPQNSDSLIMGDPFTANPTNNVYPYPPSNSRIVYGGTTLTVWFPEAPDDGSRMAVVQGSDAGDGGLTGDVLTLDGNGRTIAGANTQALTDPITAQEWFYRADLGDWVVVAALMLTNDLWTPQAVDDFWITILAIRLCPRYNKTASPELLAAFKRATGIIKARYKQYAPTTYGSQNFPTSAQSYRSNQWFM